MFEPMGGSAPKYAGQGVINPLAAIGAMGMMLDFLGEKTAAKQVESAIMSVTSEKIHSLSAGRMGYSTSEVGDFGHKLPVIRSPICRVPTTSPPPLARSGVQ